MDYDEFDRAKFFSRVVVLEQDKDGCWNWQGKVGEGGYGEFFVPMLQATITAHSVSWAMFNSVTIVHAVFNGVIQSCGNKLCCNPNHLRQDA